MPLQPNPSFATKPSASGSSPGAGALPLSALLLHAAAVVRGVLDGQSMATPLAKVPASPASARRGAQALAFHALRRLGMAQALLRALAPKRPRGDLESLLLVSLALLVQASTQATTHASGPTGSQALYDDHTVVDQAVGAARRLQAASAGFVNAVLRRFLRERVALQTDAARQHEEAAFNHPAWWVRRVRRDWPDDWAALLDQAHRHPPMTLRVHPRHGGADAYVARLLAVGLVARALPPLATDHGPVRLPQAVVLDRAVPVTQLPGFAEGHVSVQDAAAQAAAALLVGWLRARGAQAPLRVLDACAAPGGKTAHLLELDPTLQVVAVDSDAERMARVHDTLQRLGLADRAQCVVADASTLKPDQGLYDAILLDAPCTASGIVRRHPDIAWLRRDADVQALVKTQAALLDALWPLVAPGGCLLYATCSIFKAEGSEQIDAFLQRAPGPRPVLAPESIGHWRPLPDNPGETAAHDGFFYALLHHAS